MSALECLKIQVAELEALLATFPEERAVAFQKKEEEALHVARQLLLVPPDDELLLAELPALSGSVRIPDVQLHDAPVSLRFVLPRGYPLDCAAQLSVECGGPRALHEHLGQVVRAAADSAQGSECLLLAVSELRDSALQQGAADLGTAACSSAHSGDGASGRPSHAVDKSGTLSMCRAFILFHHIKSTAKRRFIVDRARELRIGGACKPGFPGIIVCEGEEADVLEYISGVKGLGWQMMQVRGQETEVVAQGPLTAPLTSGSASALCAEEGLAREGEGGEPCRQGQVRDVPCKPKAKHAAAAAAACPPLRRFGGVFQEVPEAAGMAVIGQLCRDAGLEHMFLTSLKIRAA